MDAEIRRLIELLHRGSYRYGLALTGGGTQAAASLLNVPGGSRTIVEVAVPYHENALADYLGYRPAQFCSTAAARDLARRAYQRTCQLLPGSLAAGLGCTASLASDRPKKGDHRFHLAVVTSHGSTTWSLTLNKGARDRLGEEMVLDLVLFNALAEVFGVPQRLAVPLLPGEEVHVENEPASPMLASLYAGALPALCQEPDGRLRADAPRPGLILSGSFNPLHQGHQLMAEVASRRVGLECAWELSLSNADKPPLIVEDVARRRRQFLWKATLWLTCAPRFVEKARLFPGATFVVGEDTARRLVQPRFYQHSASAMLAALSELRERGCRFLVAGRLDASGRFHSLREVPLPPGFEGLFEEIPEEECRVDVSSTALREKECTRMDLD